MLVSHRRRFIYLKTRKTAGTSVEVLLERECVPEGEYQGPRHESPGLQTSAGIIGCRLMGSKAPLNPHMTASEVRALVGDETWSNYLKFCIVRNPFDKLVSMWWYKMNDVTRTKLEKAGFSKIRSEFNAWLRGRKDLSDRNIYTVDGLVAVDRFLRFENLWSDITDLAAGLEFAVDREDLGQYKSGYRARPESFADYYDPASREIVNNLYAWEIGRFGYAI